ncbi:MULTISPECIES: Gp138 family membrane-puncturing spike protein [Brenneria]|uniref:Phage protein Gp138 N-terminal domain-containing protein n=1 Tax=Brenneria nigrifluens DSM 30175 = ATCC 13028 TaxID=1121120 RepID=A0A2U1UTW4_9GAMM|nr:MULTISPECIES: Gp138 family membrane-puncturing spike protein [Brenneria]EHD21771.1 hypothetical protein BrE312_2391 [Brenneria sp. EniD312]PWC25124.1 hypothetical protein DDT54_04275 [Brenneria nigrifluens DSM 30175 = ATCC 13028]QCR04881.1 hypothetical protein EH206_12240 [Brenneria nigrifluens DSM 30175 = ATCC 13028]
MDSTKRENPLYEAIEAAKLATVSRLMVCLPGKIISYNPDNQRAQVECGIQRKNGDSFETLSIIENVPVNFSGTKEWTVFHELPVGTEGVIHFSQRAIDTWLDQGGPVAPHNMRMFSASDAFFSPGYRSLKTAIPDLPTSGMGMGNRDGSVRIHLTDNGITLTCGGVSLTVSHEGVTHNGKTTLNGRTEVTAGGLSVGDIDFDNHVHSGVERGGSNTNGPQ